jgi:hypothetical protein
MELDKEEIREVDAKNSDLPKGGALWLLLWKRNKPTNFTQYFAWISSLLVNPSNKQALQASTYEQE